LHFKRRTEEEHHAASHRHQQSPHSGGTGNTQSSQGAANDCTCHRAGDNTLSGSFGDIRRVLSLREKKNPCWDDVQQQSEMLRRIRIKHHKHMESEQQLTSTYAQRSNNP
jgi:hypothetical protein